MTTPNGSTIIRTFDDGGAFRRRHPDFGARVRGFMVRRPGGRIVNNRDGVPMVFSTRDRAAASRAGSGPDPRNTGGSR
jgi:hypothetical protein